MPPDAPESRTQLHGLLASCLGNGIESVLLMSHDGDLLGSATARQQEEQQQGRPSSCEVVGAVASHIWCTYERAGETGVAPQNTASEGVGCKAPPATLGVRENMEIFGSRSNMCMHGNSAVVLLQGRRWQTEQHARAAWVRCFWS